VYYSYQMISALSVVMLLNTFIGFGLLDPANQAIPIFIGFFWGNIQRNKTRVEINYDMSADNKQVQRAKYYR
jgi:hypothetical protein